MKKLSIIFSTILLALVLSGCVYDDRDYCSDARLEIENTSNYIISVHCNGYTQSLSSGSSFVVDLGDMYLDDYNLNTISVGYSTNGVYYYTKDITLNTCYDKIYVDDRGFY
jgi:type 1 fimbria pilin